MIYRQLFPPLRIWRGGVQGGIMSCFPLPFTVEIVSHNIDEVQVASGRRKKLLDIVYIIKDKENYVKYKVFITLPKSKVAYLLI